VAPLDGPFHWPCLQMAATAGFGVNLLAILVIKLLSSLTLKARKRHGDHVVAVFHAFCHGPPAKHPLHALPAWPSKFTAQPVLHFHLAWLTGMAFYSWAGIAAMA
jgi:hypothetical protein